MLQTKFRDPQMVSSDEKHLKVLHMSNKFYKFLSLSLAEPAVFV